jgi:ribosomal protein S18 acetylase RimI-like enzyme
MLVTNKNKYSSEDFFNWLEAEDQHCYFLIDDYQEVVGYGEIWVGDKQKDLEFAHLIINPMMRNRGIGKVLIILLQEKAKLFKFPIIYMRVNPQNTQAINCYVKCNFEVDLHLNEMWQDKWKWLKKSIN